MKARYTMEREYERMPWLVRKLTADPATLSIPELDALLDQQVALWMRLEALAVYGLPALAALLIYFWI